MDSTWLLRRAALRKRELTFDMGPGKSWQSWCWLAGGLLLLTTAMLWASPRGYLLQTGPLPLRFDSARPRSATQPLSQLALTNPLRTLPPAAIAASAASNLPPADWARTARDVPATSVATSALAAPSEEFEPPFDTSRQPVRVTPQMLAEYFRPVSVGTNGGGAVISVPIQFVPPVPIEPSSSRATYKSSSSPPSP